jgi:two-component system sensor histidine kinase/response regulator
MKLILVIDDEEQIRSSFGMALRECGYRVIESDSGESGLQMAREQMPDLILTDINMPGVGGQALLHQIRADPELSTRQVVLMTGRPDLVPPRRGMEQGADDFLVKPVSFDALTSCIKARLSRADIHWRVEDRVLSKLQPSITSHLPHEFITPLAGILGLTEILRADFANLSDEEMQDFLKDIDLSAKRLHRTIKNYLLMLELQSASEANKDLPPVLRPSQVRECIKTGVDMVVERLGRGEDVTTELRDCPIHVRPADLAQIVEELVDNALKFSRVSTSVEVGLSDNGVLSVVDSGRGMSDEEIEHVGAFRQFDRKRLEQQGLGLGLVLVQKAAARNGAIFSLSRGSEHGMEAKVHFQMEAPNT